jgi:ATP-dependent DNA helicase RecQ
MKGNSLHSRYINSSPKRVLFEVFGFKKFKHLQSEIISTIISNKDCLGILPTGGGKSLCYQIPTLIKPGITIVISPLISLMEDQVIQNYRFGIHSCALHSQSDLRKIYPTFRNPNLFPYKMLYLSPESLLSGKYADLLDLMTINLFVIDEAHCISTWGHEFRPDYRGLRIIKRIYPMTPLLALTASATVETRIDIPRQLGTPNCKVYCSSFYRPNIRIKIQKKKDLNRQLLAILNQKEIQEKSGIIYCSSRPMTHKISKLLQLHGHRSLIYHAGLDQQIKKRHLLEFLNNDQVIIVATIAFGMGINKPNVKFIIHIDLPASLESYYQQIGRAGRDGKPALTWLLYNQQDLSIHRFFIKKSKKRQKVNERKIDILLDFLKNKKCRHSYLSTYFGEQKEFKCGNCDNCLENKRLSILITFIKKSLYRKFNLTKYLTILIGILK